jgi:hypothetical protein
VERKPPLPEDSWSEAAEKSLSDQKSMKDADKPLSDDQLKQPETAIEAINERLANACYEANS